MGRNRTTIARLMFLIALLSVDCLILRAGLSEIGSGPYYLAYQLAMIGLASQVGLERVIYGRADRRPFWVGFVAAGLLGASSLFWGVGFVNQLWYRLLGWEDRKITDLIRLMPALRISLNYRVPHFLAGALMFFPPALFTALVGGTMASSFVRMRDSTANHPGATEPPL